MGIIITWIIKRREESSSPWLGSNYNKFIILSGKIVNNISKYNSNKDTLRKVTVNIGLGRIKTWEGITVGVLLNSEVIGLVMRSEFARKQSF